MPAPFLLVLALAATDPVWSIQDSGVTTSIRGISGVDSQVCWLGTRSGVARTIDGGRNWRFTRIGGDELDFRDLHAFDARKCVAMSAGTGEASRLYLTVDGGESWRLVHRNTEPAGFFNGLAFRDDMHGILAGDPVGGRLYLLATEDGGAHWHRIAGDSAPEMKPEEHAFAASGTHLAVNGSGRIWVTSGGAVARVFLSEDWGETWESVATPMTAGQPSRGIFSILFQGQDGIAVGGDYAKESEGGDDAMRSRDGGRTWQLVKKADGAAPFPFRSCVGALDAETLVAVGPSGSDISRDGGATWRPLPGEVGFHTLSIAGGTVWAAGGDGRVATLRLATE